MSELYKSDHYITRRQDKFVVTELVSPCAVLATAFVNGGYQRGLKYIVNHQCVEGKKHIEEGDKIQQMGQQAYHNSICEKLNIPSEETVIMSTAANMRYMAVKTFTHKELEVTALTTAGVQGNAGRAGDVATWHEEDDAWEKLHREAGTINTILLVNWPLSQGAHSRALVTATEGKTAALMDLAVSSRYSSDMATGTGTDQITVAAPLDDNRKPKNWAGKHSKLGELIGRAVLDSTKESLRWQNGLEPSYTRGMEHALARFGFSEQGLEEYLQKNLNQKDFELYQNNSKSVLFDPAVSASCFALAAVWDRSTKDSFPLGAIDEVLNSQCALLALQISGSAGDHQTYMGQLSDSAETGMDKVYGAIALGWKHKWN